MTAASGTDAGNVAHVTVVSRGQVRAGAGIIGIGGLGQVGLTTIVDFAGFGSTTLGAIEAVAPGGRVIQVGMGRVVVEFNAIPSSSRWT